MFDQIFDDVDSVCERASYPLPRASGRDTGAPGNLLEKLLGIETNTRDTADFADAGVEAKWSSKTTPVTLFHLDPLERPTRATKYAPRVPGAVENLIREFGYINDDRLLAFRHMIKGGNPTTGNRVNGFYLTVDGEHINVRHVSRNKPVASWDKNVVTNAIVQKGRRMVVVTGERDLDEVSYNEATFFSEPRSSQIVEMIRNGTIMIDFDARLTPTGGVRNHGVKFRIYYADLKKLYLNRETICDYN